MLAWVHLESIKIKQLGTPGRGFSWLDHLMWKKLILNPDHLSWEDQHYIWVIWGCMTNGISRQYLWVAAHIKGHERQRLLLFICFTSLSGKFIYPIAQALLLTSSGFYTGWISAGHPALWAEQVPDSWPFHQKTESIGLAKSQSMRQFQNYALAKCMKVFLIFL